MIEQLDIYGHSLLEKSIERIRRFEPPEGYYLAFSGGKDSVVVKALADMAGVKYDAVYHITSVDPPELVQFIKTFPDVVREYPRDSEGNVLTMWNVIARNTMPPTRLARYCCAALKEGGGRGRFVITGVRRAESVRRRNWPGVEIVKTREGIDPDNPSEEEMLRICPTAGKKSSIQSLTGLMMMYGSSF